VSTDYDGGKIHYVEISGTKGFKQFHGIPQSAEFIPYTGKAHPAIENNIIKFPTGIPGNFKVILKILILHYLIMLQ